MKAAGKKEKGRRLELRVAKDLRDSKLDLHATRMPLSGSAYGLESDIRTSLPLMIECKNQESWSPLEYYNQAKEHAGSKMPLVIMARNRVDPFALLLWNDFLEILTYAVQGGWSGELPFSKRKQTRR